jgi:hypothetical protein
MKIKFLFLSLSAMFIFSNCEKVTTPEPTNTAPVVVTVIEKPLPLVEMPMTESLQKMIPYTASQIVNFQLHTNDNLAYQAKPRESSKFVTQAFVNGVSSLVNFEIARVAILPNRDSLKCMMLTVNSFSKIFEVLIEDNLAGKWNYFRLNFDDYGSFVLNKNASGNMVESINTLTINSIDYHNVYKVTNSNNDTLWFSLQSGVLKAELADGRTWSKK